MIVYFKGSNGYNPNKFRFKILVIGQFFLFLKVLSQSPSHADVIQKFYLPNGFLNLPTFSMHLIEGED